ncbi:hypothetical protein BMJ32_14980 [Sinorhizobium medicae]|uniref:Uncharacterized protein n=1 Tax=Sinorhizobium medicae TaxID=110321 RepID=A0A508WSL0_9HYPH|nr:hypothetical protein BMJ32_14980 [Sinorhizobium medicae]PLU24559.1 hypothetical protein BMJ31_12410 [Sinorhizobium medicae]PLU42897.1 hypothetical protein BMJ25_29495 [Sinorhizobium medicae]PLU44444.1 hypothetical protein BMJ26_01970 [Sinorhizobium medicae]PLU46326.1 hypothetical protein BMJ28_00200 [Sinorhizobium medicae]
MARGLKFPQDMEDTIPISLPQDGALPTLNLQPILDCRLTNSDIAFVIDAFAGFVIESWMVVVMRRSHG